MDDGAVPLVKSGTTIESVTSTVALGFGDIAPLLKLIVLGLPMENDSVEALIDAELLNELLERVIEIVAADERSAGGDRLDGELVGKVEMITGIDVVGLNPDNGVVNVSSSPVERATETDG